MAGWTFDLIAGWLLGSALIGVPLFLALGLVAPIDPTTLLQACATVGTVAGVVWLRRQRRGRPRSSVL